MIRLSGEVGACVIVFIGLEGVVAQIAPEDRRHAELVGPFEGLADFLNLTVGLFGTEVDGCTDGDGAEIPGLFYLSKKNLVIFARIGDEVVVIDLDDKGNLMRVFASY